MIFFYFPIGILGQVWYLIVSTPDLCPLLSVRVVFGSAAWINLSVNTTDKVIRMNIPFNDQDKIEMINFPVNGTDTVIRIKLL